MDSTKVTFVMRKRDWGCGSKKPGPPTVLDMSGETPEISKGGGSCRNKKKGKRRERQEVEEEENVREDEDDLIDIKRVKREKETKAENEELSEEEEKEEKLVSYSVVYGKPSTRKHKVWENDGVIEIRGRSVTLKDDEGKILDRNSKLEINQEMVDGKSFRLGGKEVQIVDLLG